MLKNIPYKRCENTENRNRHTKLVYCQKQLYGFLKVQSYEIF